MELFSFDHDNRRFALMVDLDLQLERLLVDGAVLSVKPLAEITSSHEFDDAHLGQGKLTYTLAPPSHTVTYELTLLNQAPIQATTSVSDEAKALFVAESTENVAPPARNGRSGLMWLAVGFKLLKSFSVLKVALAAASVAVYSVMFTFEFAIALIAVLVMHEYGHVRAMEKFGLPTRGFYLIPFMGGVAIGERAQTQWQALYIAMMGPVYGLFMTAIFYVIFLVTDSHFCGLVASTSALLNLANLLPVNPLDGGHVVKALVFSRRNQWGLILLLAISALMLVVAYQWHLYFLCFFIVMGVMDIVVSWNVPLSADLTPLNTNGIWYSLAWYLLVALAFLAMIFLLVEAKVPGAEIAVKILQS